MNESVWEHAQDSEWKTHWQKLGDRAEELSFEVQQRFLKGMNLTLETDLQDKKIVDWRWTSFFTAQIQHKQFCCG